VRCGDVPPAGSDLQSLEPRFIGPSEDARRNDQKQEAHEMPTLARRSRSMLRAIIGNVEQRDHQEWQRKAKVASYASRLGRLRPRHSAGSGR
jgi:hypothetical protein